MSKTITIKAGDAVCRAELFDDAAPATAAALRAALPISDRTIQVRWSGNAWRTEGNYELQPVDAPIENVAEKLNAGDIIYYPGYSSGNVKVGIAYGDAQWLAPFREPVDVCKVGRIVEGLDEFVAASKRIIFDGPLAIEITAES
ncbi:DUF3830 family protein [Kribbella turkmenica]|nr:DUF3830 family protein [Kribbella turkmenica]